MIDLLGALLTPPAWIYYPGAVVAFFFWAALGVRRFDREQRPIRPTDWFGIFFGSAVVAAFWPFVLFLVVPVGVAGSVIAGLVLLLARPPWRERPEAPTEHWVDALPEEMTMEEIIRHAEERA